MKSVEVAIIGAGSAGLSARREIAKITDSYVVIDDGPLGTTCARVGCMPSKVLIQIAKDFSRRKKLFEEGIIGGDGLTLDGAAAMKHVRKLRDRFVRGVESDMAEWTSEKLIRKRARFIHKNLLDLGDERVEARRVIIATGSKPKEESAFAGFEKYFLDTNQIFEEETLPRSMAVMGLGVIGVELGLAFAKLGVKVIGLRRSDQSFAGITDPLVRAYAEKVFSEDVKILTGNASLALGKSGATVSVAVAGVTVEVEKILNTTGRIPVLGSLGLENLGLSLESGKVPRFDSETFELSEVPGVYLVGDVNGERPILHEASDEGRVAGYNSVREKRQGFQRRVAMSVVFSYPEICSVGKTWKDLTSSGLNFIHAPVSYEGQGRAIVMLEEKGFGHLYADKDSGEFLGAELMAPHADHLAHLLAWAIEMRVTVFEILSFPFYHPVLEEGLRTGFRALARQVSKKAPPLEIKAAP